MIVAELDLAGSRSLSTPGERSDIRGGESEAPTLAKEEATRFRSIAARANYLAQDRPDIAYAVKEICSHAAAPTTESMNALKRLGRYLLVRPRLVFQYPWQGRETDISLQRQ